MVRQDIKYLKDRILRCGGNSFQPDQVIAENFDEKFVQALRDYAVFIDAAKTKVKSCPMELNLCHENVDELVKKDKNLCRFTGFGLGTNKRWFVHSWAIDKKGVIFDTTMESDMVKGYFGIPLIRDFQTKKQKDMCAELYLKLHEKDKTKGCLNYGPYFVDILP